jgi:hypothetical protein
MAEETRCPACGAQLDYTGTEDVVRCNFCGTLLSVIDQDGERRFSVLSQPEPQSEVLAERASEEIEAELAEIPEVVSVEPGFASSSTEADVDPFFPESGVPVPPVYAANTPDTTPPAYVSASPSQSKRSWWLIGGISLLIVLLLMCACMVAGVFLVMSFI